MKFISWVLAGLLVVHLSAATLWADSNDPYSGGPPASKYYWVPVASTNQVALFLNAHKIGIYDPKTNIYRRVNTDGTLSDPAPRPWKGSAVEPAHAIVAKPPDVQETPRISAPWLPFAAGGAITGLLVVVVGLVQSRRR